MSDPASSKHQFLYYIGAADDFRFLRRQQYNYKEFRLFDGMPESKYCSEECHGFKLQSNFVNIIIRKLEKKSSFRLKSQENNTLIFEDEEYDRKLIYRYNYEWKMKDMDSVPDNSDLYVSGFSPEVDWKRFNAIYGTRNCLENLNIFVVKDHP